MEVTGKIVSSAIADFGGTGIHYGYIGIERENGSHMRLKVDSYTSYETLDLGDHVIIEAENLGSTDIVVARKITKNMPFTDQVEGERETVAVS